MGLIHGNNEPERALRDGSAYFKAIMNSAATTTGRHAYAAPGAADPNAWANTLNEMAHNDKFTGISEDRSHYIPSSEDPPVFRINGEELRSLIQVEVKSTVKAAQSEEMGSMSRI